MRRTIDELKRTEVSYRRLWTTMLLLGGLLTLNSEAATANDVQEEVKVLFVANGYYPQESLIYAHLQELSEDSDSFNYDIELVSDYGISSNTDLSPYKFVILTGFAPNASTSAIENIKASAIPVLIIEYWNFIYSEKFDLVHDSWAFFGGNTLEVLDSDHTITQLMETEFEAYYPFYFSLGVGSWNIKPNIKPLVGDPTWGQASVLIDEEQHIVATGLHEPALYSDASWVLFDRILFHLHAVEFSSAPSSSLLDDLVAAGIMDQLEQFSQNPAAWTYETAMAEINSLLAAAFLPENILDFSSIVPYVLFEGEVRVVSNDAGDVFGGATKIGTLYFPADGSLEECTDWYIDLLNSNQLPASLSYHGRNKNYQPIFKLGFSNPTFEMEQHERQFAISLQQRSVSFPILIPVSPPYTFRVQNTSGLISTGSSILLSHPTLKPNDSWQQDFYPANQGDPLEFLYYWHGRRYEYASLPDVVTHTPYLPESYNYQSSTMPFPFIFSIPRQSLNPVLDYYLLEEEDLQGEPPTRMVRKHAKCAVRFHSLQSGMSIDTYKPDWSAIAAAVPTEDTCDASQGDYYNPFDYPKGDEQDTFMDAVAGISTNRSLCDQIDMTSCVEHLSCEGEADCACDSSVDDCTNLSPRFKLVWPSNAFLNYTNVVETYCRDNKDTCRDLGDIANRQQFEEDFRISAGQTFDPEKITPRHRDNVPWKNDTPSALFHGDSGPWQKPILTAGLSTPVLVTVASGMRGDAYCDDFGGVDTNIAYLTYKNASGEWIGPGSLHEMIEYVQNGELPDDGIDYPYHARMYCFPRVNVTTDALEAGEGFSYSSYVPAFDPYDVATVNDTLMKIPSNAKGSAKIVFLGKMKDRTSGDSFILRREFPVYIEPSNGSFDSNPSTAGPTCWTNSMRQGFSRRLLNNGNENPEWQYDYTLDMGGVTKSNDSNGGSFLTLPASLDYFNYDQPGYRDLPTAYHDVADRIFDGVQGWILMGDAQPWFRRIKRAGEEIIDDRFYMLTGDLPRKASLPSYFHRGSSMAFYQPGKLDIDTLEYWGISDPWWWEGDYDGQRDDFLSWDGFQGKYCPVLVPETIEPIAGFDKFEVPWEMVRARGHIDEAGEIVNCDSAGTCELTRCHETNAETMSAMAAFQMDDQEETGDAYIWNIQATSWGQGSAPGMGASSEGVDAVTNFNRSDFLYHYNLVQAPYWGSYLSLWDYDNGIDDLARSVGWDAIGTCDNDIPNPLSGRPVNAEGDGTTFVTPAVVPFEHLNDAFIDAPVPADINGDEPGIMIWHTGPYRKSPVYLSYATEQNLHSPEKYRHFAGFDAAGDPVWSQYECNAVPVIWDVIGEVSVVDHDPETYGDAALFFGAQNRFKILYDTNRMGQEGIVMKMAEYPWGPFGDSVPLFDCHSAVSTLYENRIIMKWPDIRVGSGSTHHAFNSGMQPCYNAYSHPDLWDISGDTATVRFSVSMGFNPYKNALIETTITK